MRGKIGLVVGLGVGYVLGTRAGRERYEQIKKQALKVWHLDPVQKQVGKVRDAAQDALAALPKAVWNGISKARTASSPEPDATPARPDPARPTPSRRRSSEEVLEEARERVDEAEGPAINEKRGSGR